MPYGDQQPQEPLGQQQTPPVLLEILRSYGMHAKYTIPELERLAADFADGEPGFPTQLSREKAGAVRETVRFLQETEHSPDLITLSE